MLRLVWPPVCRGALLVDCFTPGRAPTPSCLIGPPHEHMQGHRITRLIWPPVRRGALLVDCFTPGQGAPTPSCFTGSLDAPPQACKPVEGSAANATTALGDLLADGSAGDGSNGALCKLFADSSAGGSVANVTACAGGLVCTPLTVRASCCCSPRLANLDALRSWLPCACPTGAC